MQSQLAVVCLFSVTQEELKRITVNEWSNKSGSIS